jgi:hypothetical protein
LAVKLLEIPETLIVDVLKFELDAGAVVADTAQNRLRVLLASLAAVDVEGLNGVLNGSAGAISFGAP